MELILKRTTINQNYTLSRLYDAQSKQYFVLDVLEPPLAGLVSPRKVSSVTPGVYKIFLKNTSGCNISIIVQHLRRKLKYGFCRPYGGVAAAACDFHVKERFYNTPLFVGRWDEPAKTITDDPEVYERFIYRLLIARNSQETIKLIVEG